MLIVCFGKRRDEPGGRGGKGREGGGSSVACDRTRTIRFRAAFEALQPYGREGAEWNSVVVSGGAGEGVRGRG